MYEADIAVLKEESARLAPPLLALLEKALHRERSGRFQSAAEFLASIVVVARQLGITLDEPTLVPWLFQLGVMPSQSGTYALQIDPGRHVDHVPSSQRETVGIRTGRRDDGKT
jgi:hypothetical protein